MGDCNIEIAEPESLKRLYTRLLLCFVEKGLDVSQRFEHGHGTGTLLSINLVNEKFHPINEILLCGAQMTFADYFTEITAVESDFTGFICDSIMVDDKTNYKSSIQFKEMEVIYSERIHPDFFIICMNFDMISALVHFIYMFNAQHYINYECDHQIETQDGDFEMALKSLQYELAKNVPFQTAYDNWMNDEFNHEVMHHPANINELDAIRYLLENYNKSYQKYSTLYSDRILTIDKKNECTHDVNCEADPAHMNYSPQIFNNNKKRDISTSQATDQVNIVSLGQTETINTENKIANKKFRK